MEKIPIVKDLVPSAPSVSAPPPPPPPPPPPAPDLAAAEDRTRAMRDAQDASLRKRGRRSTVVTGPEGVGATPVGVKTLVGS